MNYPAPNKLTQHISETGTAYAYLPENVALIKLGKIEVKTTREPKLMIAIGQRGTGKTDLTYRRYQEEIAKFMEQEHGAKLFKNFYSKD